MLSDEEKKPKPYWQQIMNKDEMTIDEEWKAIKGLEWSQQQMRLGNLPDYDQGHYADIRIVLNLIKKQQKEIEELNKENTRQHELIGNIHKKWKDKIKAKIEEINKEMLNEEKSLELFYRKKYCKEILQSLLEKE